MRRQREPVPVWTPEMKALGLYPNDPRVPWPGLPICIYADTMTDEQMFLCLSYAYQHDSKLVDLGIKPGGIKAIHNAQLDWWCKRSLQFPQDHPWFCDLMTDHRDNLMNAFHRVEQLKYKPADVLREVKRRAKQLGKVAG